MAQRIFQRCKGSKRGYTTKCKKRETTGKNDLIANMTNRMVLDHIGIVTDGERLADEDIKFRLLVVKPSENGKKTYLGKPADVTEEFLVHIYHGTVLYYEGKTYEALPLR